MPSHRAQLWQQCIATMRREARLTLQSPIWFLGWVEMVLLMYICLSIHRMALGAGFQLFADEYVPYLMIGLSLISVLWYGVGPCVGRLKAFWDQGFLEWTLAHQPLLLWVILEEAIWSLLQALAQSGAFLLCTIWLWRIPVSLAALTYWLVAYGVTYFALLGIGLVVLANYVVLRRWSLLDRVVNWGIPLLSGVYFSVALLPPWLRWLSSGLPTTHLLRLTRAVWIEGGVELEHWQALAMLGGIGIGCLLTGIWVIQGIVDRLKQVGTLLPQ